ncbi:MAG TPA: hypothetical protein VGW12_11580 [Pyrinomonadaceae bacterium]|nr:hypothetical protein [Pyrinomonadaceae bacterium]
MGGAADEREARAADDRAPGGKAQTPAHRSALVEEAARVAATLNDKLPPLADETNASGNHKAAPELEARTREDANAYDAHAPQVFEQRDAEEDELTESAAAATRGEPRGRIRQRAASVGASVGENLRPRVEKLREASTVVFDEATDDPGLRFVIVASVLFVVFILIFILSYILG